VLVSLSVRNFAIVDRIEVEFGPGMTVLTGETGAGKSILIDALALVLGERGSSKVVRPGAQRAEFSASFDLADLDDARNWLAGNELDEDGDCLIRRIIGADGRSRAFINGHAVTMQQLKDLGDFLLDIHGQHFHQSLTRKQVQRDLLDHFGGLDAEVEATAEAFARWQSLVQELENATGREAERASRIDLLRFQVDELAKLAPEADEAAELATEQQRLKNSGRLADGAATALALITENDEANAAALVAEALRQVESLVEYDASLAEVAEFLDAAGIQLNEATDALQRYAGSLDADPARRDWVEERLASLKTVARKHQVEPEELPGKLEAMQTELEALLSADERGKELEARVADAERQYMTKATKLSKRRHAAAAKFNTAVTEAMQGLGMPGGEFGVDLKTLDAAGARASGIDTIEFLISANPGQPPEPLSRVASGGELSRMSLAIQVIASDGSRIPTLIFDEVDSGVGGGVAEMVGRRLCDLGTSRQVLCVTHLPQVAALAQHHLRIAKVTDGKATRTTARELGREERVEEIARMLGGVDITEKTLEHAAEMLTESAQKRA
jgi:DNA repair protein RecN (Recombination protein N)